MQRESPPPTPSHISPLPPPPGHLGEKPAERILGTCFRNLLREMRHDAIVFRATPPLMILARAVPPPAHLITCEPRAPPARVKADPDCRTVAAAAVPASLRRSSSGPHRTKVQHPTRHLDCKHSHTFLYILVHSFHAYAWTGKALLVRDLSYLAHVRPCTMNAHTCTIASKAEQAEERQRDMSNACW